MNRTTIVLAVFKPAIRKKFEFAEIHKCIFKANTITDTLNLEGVGIKKGEVLGSRVELTTLKLSENQEFITMFVNNVKDKINNLKEIKASNFEIDFESKKINSEIFYLNNEDRKLKINLELKF
jgi:hypothetical protein